MNLLEGINPVTRILGLALLTTPLLVSIDWVSATVAIVATLVAAPLCGVSFRRLARRGWPLLLLAPIAGIPMALYGQSGGEVYFDYGLIQVSELSVSLAWAITLRVLAVALPVVVLSADVDPTDLGDGLAQVLKLPARFVLGSVAALRMLTLLREDVEAMRRARRSRGIADVNRVRYAFSLAFGLLVMSLRRAGKLATAMEARAFGRAGERTWARESKMRTRDWVVLIICVLLAAVALGAAWVTGEFRPVWAVS